MANWIDSMDAFGDTCPANWEDIASWLNDKLDELCPEFDPDNWENRETANKLWEDFAAGDLYADGCPRPVLWDLRIDSRNRVERMRYGFLDDTARLAIGEARKGEYITVGGYRIDKQSYESHRQLYDDYAKRNPAPI